MWIPDGPGHAIVGLGRPLKLQSGSPPLSSLACPCSHEWLAQKGPSVELGWQHCRSWNQERTQERGWGPGDEMESRSALACPRRVGVSSSPSCHCGLPSTKVQTDGLPLLILPGPAVLVRANPPQVREREAAQPFGPPRLQSDLISVPASLLLPGGRSAAYLELTARSR